jgi:hypothetical protein
MSVTQSEKHHGLQKIGHISILFLLPLLGSAILALPPYLLHQSGLSLPLSIYAGELLVSLYLIHRFYGLTRCGLKGIPKLSDFTWALLFLVLRSIIWIAFLPVSISYFPLPVVISDLLFFVLVNAATEEIHFRGLLYTGIQAQISRPIVAAVISSLLFGLLHLSLGEPLWIPLFIADGLAWCGIRIRTGSVYPAILSHGLQNLLFTRFLVVPQDLSAKTELVYTITAIVVDVLFFTIAVNKNFGKYGTRRYEL